jgi:hypothetical protein
MEKPTTAGPAPTVTRHIVMWNVRGATQPEKNQAAQLIKASFEALAGKIPGMRSVEVGIDMSGVDYACDVVLCMDFESPALLTAYATHPEHLRVKDLLGDSRIARYQVDYITPAASHGREHDHV